MLTRPTQAGSRQREVSDWPDWSRSWHFIWARSDEAYAWLAANLTIAKFEELVPETSGLEVRRFDLPNLRSLNFVVVGLLGEGVASSVRFDGQAKSLGEYLRSRVVDLPESLLA